ncbi:MAG: carboxypeptidase regulatory-like domain-containing protein [Planctomycetota bacterium]
MQSLFRGPKFWRFVVPVMLLGGVAACVAAFAFLFGAPAGNGPGRGPGAQRTTATTYDADATEAARRRNAAGASDANRGNVVGDDPGTIVGDPGAGGNGTRNNPNTNAGGNGNGGNVEPVVVIGSNGLRIPGMADLLNGAGSGSHDSGGPHGSASGSNGRSGAVDGTDPQHSEDETPATTGVVTGVVTARESDGQMQPVEGLIVSVLLNEKDPATAGPGERFDGRTDSSGVYRIANVPPGAVKVTIPQTGETSGEWFTQSYYEPVTRYGVVNLGEETRIDLLVQKPFDLVGRCIGPDGLPAAGVTVRLWRTTGFGQGTGTPQFSVVSDANGIFRLGEMPDETYRLNGDKAGYTTVVIEQFRPSDYGLLNPLELHFGDDLAVTGRVTDGDNQPLEGVRITAQHVEEGNRWWRSTVLTDGDGNYRVPVEAASINTIIAARAGYGTQKVEGILPGRRGLNFVMSANGKGGVTGRVLDVDGTNCTHFTVNGVLFENNDGRFDLELPDGDVTLTIQSDRTGGVATVPATVTAPTISDVGLISLVGGVTLDVWVFYSVGWDEIDIADATVRLNNTGLTLRSPNHPDGRYYRFEALPPGVVLSFSVSHPMYVTRTVTVDPDAMPTNHLLGVPLSDGSNGTDVRVTDAANAPLVGATVTWLGAGGSERNFATGDDGVAHLTGLTGGNASVRVSASGYVTSATQAVPTVDLDKPDAVAPMTTIILQPGGSVWGEVTALGETLLGGAGGLPTIRLEPVSGGQMTTVPVQITLPDGTKKWRYEFRDVPTGEFWLSSMEWFCRQTYTLQEGQATQVNIDLPGRGTLTARLLNSDGSPATNRTVYLYTLDTWTVTRSSTTGPDGRVSYPMLPPGDWVLSIIIHGSSDQHMELVTLAPNSNASEHTIHLPPTPGWIDGRVLVRNDAVQYSERATLTPQAGITSFVLNVRLPDDTTVRAVQCDAPNGAGSAADVATAINNSSDAQSVGLIAQTDGTAVVLSAANPNVLPFFGVQAADAAAEALFGTAPFQSSHAAGNVKVSLERLDCALQTLLAGYISVDPQGYYRMSALAAGSYRPRVAAHYTGAPMAEAFGRDVTVPASGSMPFVTMWTGGADSYVDVTGSFTIVGGGKAPTTSVIVYVDDLSEPPTSWPPSPGERSETKRHGYFFGGVGGTSGSFSIPRLARGHSYRARIYVTGMQPGTVEFSVPASGPATLALPGTTLQWDPRFDRR